MNGGLSCSGLVAGYGRITVNRGVDLTVHAGELVAVLGPNGAGKSTLLRGLAGISQKGGTVVVGDVDVTGKSAAARVRAGLSFVPESRGNIFPTMTVRDNQSVAGRRTQAPRRREILDLVQQLFPPLSAYADRPAGLLSGGEQQMVALSMALLQDPSVILLDEPSQGLAPSVMLDIQRALDSLRPSGITILLAEQNQRFAHALADRVLHIEGGDLVPASRAWATESAQGPIGVVP